MIVQYEEGTGIIKQIVFDPVHPDVRTAYLLMPNILDLEPVATPYRPELNAEGEPIIFEDGTPSMINDGMLYADVDPTADYVLDGEIYVRPTFEAPETVTLSLGETQTISTLPTGTKVIMDGEEFGTIDEDGLVFQGDMPAAYSILLELAPYIPHTIQVTVNAT